MYFTHFSPSGTDGKWTSLGNSSALITGYAWIGTIRFSSAWKLEKKIYKCMSCDSILP